jgi:hypothetical protein
MANAILFSGLESQTIELPLDGAAYEARLNRLIQESTFEKKAVETRVEDFSKSFNR